MIDLHYNDEIFSQYYWWIAYNLLFTNQKLIWEQCIANWTLMKSFALRNSCKKHFVKVAVELL